MAIGDRDRRVVHHGDAEERGVQRRSHDGEGDHPGHGPAEKTRAEGRERHRLTLR